MSYRLEWGRPCQELLAVRYWRRFDEAAAVREAAIEISVSDSSLLLRLVIYKASPNSALGIIDIEECFPDLGALRAWVPEARLPCSTLGSAAWRRDPAETERLGERLLASVRAVGDWGAQNGLLSEDAVRILCGTAAAHLEDGRPTATT
ncbi:MAG TPA: hypothetical protein VF680_07505 [Allosphingosinicella sp.]|jgi:hypothetical protein